MSLDINTLNTPVVQLAALEQVNPPHQFLYELFVEDGGVVTEEEAIYDTRRGKTPMAPFVHSGAAGVPLGRGAFQMEKITFPTLKPAKNITLSDIKKRMFGEQIYGGLSPEDRAAKLAMEDLEFLRKTIYERLEWMTAQLLFNGTIDVMTYTGDGRVTIPDKVVDFGFDTKYTAATPWNQAGADIQTNLSDVYDLVEQGLGTSEVIIMAPDVKAAIMNNEAFLKKLNLLHVNNGNLTTEHRYPGVTYLGTSPDGQEMYSYSGKVVNEAMAEVPLIPSGKLICGSRKMLKIVFGPVIQLEQADEEFHSYAAREVPNRLSNKDTNVITQSITSRPMIMPKNVTGWAVADVL